MELLITDPRPALLSVASQLQRRGWLRWSGTDAAGQGWPSSARARQWRGETLLGPATLPGSEDAPRLSEAQLARLLFPDAPLILIQAPRGLWTQVRAALDAEGLTCCLESELISHWADKGTGKEAPCALLCESLDPKEAPALSAELSFDLWPQTALSRAAERQRCGEGGTTIGHHQIVSAENLPSALRAGLQRNGLLTLSLQAGRSPAAPDQRTQDAAAQKTTFRWGLLEASAAIFSEPEALLAAGHQLQAGSHWRVCIPGEGASSELSAAVIALARERQLELEWCVGGEGPASAESACWAPGSGDRPRRSLVSALGTSQDWASQWHQLAQAWARREWTRRWASPRPASPA